MSFGCGYMCSGFPTERVEQTIMMSVDNITMIAHAIWGGKYIRRVHSGFGAVIWVSGTECLGQVTDPLLWLYQCLYWSRSILRVNCFPYLFMGMHPYFLGTL